LDGQKEVVMNNVTDGDSQGDPLIYNDVAYIPGKNLVAIDLKTNQLLWKLDINKNNSTSDGLIAALSTDGERIFFGDWLNRIFAVNMKTGNILWSRDKSGLGDNYIAVRNGSLYFGKGGEENYKNHKSSSWTFGAFKIDAVTGKTIWNTTITGWSSSSFAVSEDVAAVSCVNKVVGLNTQTGKIIWTINANIPETPVLVKDFLYFIERDKNNDDGYQLHAVNKLTGKILWTFQLPESNMAYGMMPYNKRLYISGAPSSVLVLEQQKTLHKNQ